MSELTSKSVNRMRRFERIVLQDLKKKKTITSKIGGTLGLNLYFKLVHTVYELTRPVLDGSFCRIIGKH